MKHTIKLKKIVTEDNADSPILGRNGYVYIEDVENHLHPIVESKILQKLYSIYLKKIKQVYENQNYSVTIFIASGNKIDEKIDSINRRLKNKEIINCE